MKQIMNKMLFPATYAINFFSITLLLIASGILGATHFAAEVGLAQAAAQAVFLAFSSNARNLILAENGRAIYEKFVQIRVYLLLPLLVVAYFLCASIPGGSQAVIWLILLRRTFDWVEEINISNREREGDVVYARMALFLQCLSLAIVVLSLFIKNIEVTYSAMALWALSPVILSFRHIFITFMTGAKVTYQQLSLFIPHLGSTWAIALSLYVFRMLVYLLAGKEVSGILYTAYAIGGMISSLYMHSIGPSLALLGEKAVPKNLRTTELLIFVILIVSGIILTSLGQGDMARNSSLFYSAIGLSLCGSSLMLMAQKKRIQLLQNENKEVFIPDVMSNLLLISSVPFLYYLLGVKSLSALYFISSALALVFYTVPYLTFQSVQQQKNRVGALFNLSILNRVSIQTISLYLLFIPLFLQMSGSILFINNEIIYDHGGDIRKLPLPVSVLSCFICLIFLMNYEKCKQGATFIFSTFILMLLAVFFGTGASEKLALGKMILLIQFILPMFGIFLGQSYIEPVNKRFSMEAICIHVLLFVVAMEVLSTVIRGTILLHPNIYLFSIYQHLQYVPMIFTVLSIIAISKLSHDPRFRVELVCLGILMPIYLCMSLSHEAIGVAVMSLLIYLWSRKSKIPARYFVYAVALILLSLFASYLIMATDLISERKNDAAIFDQLIGLESLFTSLGDRVGIWQFYMARLFATPEAFLFGINEQEQGIMIAQSAHNYYIDMMFHFGVLSLLPMVAMMFYIFRELYAIYKTRNEDVTVLSLAYSVLLLLLADNMLKVGMRQPYPGIITFFLVGLLLAKLKTNSNES